MERPDKHSQTAQAALLRSQFAKEDRLWRRVGRWGRGFLASMIGTIVVGGLLAIPRVLLGDAVFALLLVLVLVLVFGGLVLYSRMLLKKMDK